MVTGDTRKARQLLRKAVEADVESRGGVEEAARLVAEAASAAHKAGLSLEEIAAMISSSTRQAIADGTADA